MGHHEPGRRVVVVQLGHVEQVRRRLQEPPVRRSVGMQESKDSLLVGVGRQQVGLTPPGPVRGHRQGHLLRPEVQGMDEDVFGRAVDRRDVARITAAARHLRAARIRGLAREIRGRYRRNHLPQAGRTELRVHAQEIVQGRGRRPRESEDHQGPFERRRSVTTFAAVPGFDLESVRQPPDDGVLDPLDRRRVRTQIVCNGIEQVLQTDLPTIHPKIVEPGRRCRPVDERLRRGHRHAFGPRFDLGRAFDHAVGLLAVPAEAGDALLDGGKRSSSRRRFGDGLYGRDVRLGVDRHVASLGAEYERHVLAARHPIGLPRGVDELGREDFAVIEHPSFVVPDRAVRIWVKVVDAERAIRSRTEPTSRHGPSSPNSHCAPWCLCAGSATRRL